MNRIIGLFRAGDGAWNASFWSGRDHRDTQLRDIENWGAPPYFSSKLDTKSLTTVRTIGGEVTLQFGNACSSALEIPRSNPGKPFHLAPQ